MNNESPLLQVDQLSFSYGDLRALEGVRFELHPGEVLGLLGPNGAGKTTLVHCCTGRLKPAAGQVRHRQGDPANPAVRRSMGVAPQGGALYDGLSAREQVELFAGLQGLRGREKDAAAREALAFVGLQEKADKRAETLSGGMRQRLNLAMAVVHKPPLLFLDEPTVGVDAQSRNALLDGIEALRRKGHGILYTTHYMPEAERLCDRVGIIDRGRLLELDSVPALLEAHGGDPLVIQETEGREIRHSSADPLLTLDELRRQGAQGRFRVEYPGLEQVFLRCTGHEIQEEA